MLLFPKAPFIVILALTLLPPILIVAEREVEEDEGLSSLERVSIP